MIGRGAREVRRGREVGHPAGIAMLSGLAALVLAGPAQGATLYGAVGTVALAGQTEDPGSVLILDPADAGILGVVGDVTAAPDTGVVGLAADSQGRLFGTTKTFGTGTELVRIATEDGAPSPLLENVGAITYGGTPVSINDLAFQPGTDILFGTASGAGAEPCASCLFTIDLATAEATLVGDPSLSNPAWNKSGGLAFGPDGTLYGTTTFTSPILAVLDPTDGSVLSTESVVVAPPDDTELGGFFDGLAVDPDTGLLYATHGVGGEEVLVRDPGTGAWSVVGETGHALSDLAFRVPEPTVAALLALALAGVGALAPRAA